MNRKGVILLILVLAVINYIWLAIDNFPLWFDHGQYYQKSILLFFASQQGPLDFVREVLGIGAPYWCHIHRIIIPLFSLPFYYILGLSADAAVLSGTIFLAAALLSTYAIATRLFDKRTGFLAAFILATSPGLFIYSRRYSPEFATIGIVALMLYFLLRTENFRNRLFSILFGLSFGLSMLTKEMSAAFVVGPAAYILYKANLSFLFKGKTSSRRSLFVNLILALSCAAAVMAPLYILHSREVFSNIFDAAYSTEVQQIYGMVRPFSLRGLTFYIYEISVYNFLPLFSFGFILGVIFCIRKKIPNRAFLFWWLIGGYIVLCSTLTRLSEYSLPLLPALAIVSAYGVRSLFKKRLQQNLLVAFVIVWGSGQLLISSFHFQKAPLWLYYRQTLLGNNFERYYPSEGDWQAEQIIDYLLANKDNPGEIGSVHLGANFFAFSPVVLEYTAVEKGAKFVFMGYSVHPEEIWFCDFVVIKSGPEQGMFYSLKQVEELSLQLEERDDFIKLPRSFPLPDGSQAVIYKKIEAED